MRYVTAAQMREIDALAIKSFGIAGIVLMENAGLKILKHAYELVPNLKSVAIFCGKGNNGGDGLVLARHLHIDGHKVKVFFAGELKLATDEVLINLNIIQKLKVPTVEILKPKDLKKVKGLSQYDLIVDALFGTGFSGECHHLHALIIDTINRSEKPVLSVDIPSGLDATSGKIGNACVKANRTVTFGLPKKGQKINFGPDFTGDLFIENISFPQSLLG